MKKGIGSEGFSRHYWEANYSAPDEMDCIGNAKQHAAYLKSLFELEFVDISSVIDFGFGLGHLFQEVMRAFIPYKAYGIEPSAFAFERADVEKWKPVESTNLRLENLDLVSWAEKSTPNSKHYDLGICTSVFQYLSDDEIDRVLPVMAGRVKYLYFSVPTNKELDRQIEDLEFKDEYAIRRSRTWYQKKLKPHFTFISSRLIESKVHFDESSTHFTDLLFRF